MPQINESASPLPKIVLTPMRHGVPAQGGTMEVLVRVSSRLVAVQEARYSGDESNAQEGTGRRK